MASINLADAVREDITVTRGDSLAMGTNRFWSDSAKTVPIDISGDTFKMEVKDSAGTIILTLVTPTNFVIHDTNEVDIVASNTQMEVEPSPNGQPYSYDIEWTKSTGVVKTYQYGYFVIKNDITNNA
jgi:hypothetical protein